MTAWFAIRLHEQVQSLKLAQAEILMLNQQLEKMAYFDGLTEIPNRRSFDVTIEKELGRAHRYKHPLAVILFDIDYFKAYNDYYGHQVGDHCLQKVAQTINAMAQRTTDIAARFGGEEFVLLLPDTDLPNAERIGKMTLQAIANLQIPHEKSLVSNFVTVSAGISACNPSAETSIKDLIRCADQALYEAKTKGKFCLVSKLLPSH